MKKRVLFLLLFLVIGWNWDTHKGIIESSFERFPGGLREKLSLPLMQDGSLRPDRDFHDFINHSYPRSIGPINYWLNLSKVAFLNKDYTTSSIAFGIASHYISDSYSAPHYVTNEDYNDHLEYENQAEAEFDVECRYTNLEEDITTVQKGKKLEWDNWLKNNGRKYSKQSSEAAAVTVYNTGLNLFDVECEQSVENHKLKWILVPTMGFIVLIILYFYLRKYF